MGTNKDYAAGNGNCPETISCRIVGGYELCNLLSGRDIENVCGTRALTVVIVEKCPDDRAFLIDCDRTESVPGCSVRGSSLAICSPVLRSNR